MFLQGGQPIANGVPRKCSASITIRKMQMKATQSCPLTLVSMVLLSRTTSTDSKNVEKLKLFYIC